MTPWKLTLSYDGGPFHGWQVQPGLRTVQGTLAEALKDLTGETVLPQGSGRTDAGVHALAQVATVALATPIPAENLVRALNRALPQAIRVLAAEVAPESFHARHSAVQKTYEYRIFERRPAEGSSVECSPFLAPYVWDCPWRLNVEAMQQAAGMFLGTRNFTSFAASDPDKTLREAEAGSVNPVKTLFASEFQRENGLLVYRVTGSGFLHHMVRNLVGTLVEVGRGALEPADMNRILEAKDRSAAGPTAPAKGLFLVAVDYER